MIKFVSHTYTLQDDTTCDKQISLVDEIVFKPQCLNCMQENTNWCWEQKNQEQVIFFNMNYCTFIYWCSGSKRCFWYYYKSLQQTQIKNNIYKDILYVWLTPIIIICLKKFSIEKNWVLMKYKGCWWWRITFIYL